MSLATSLTIFLSAGLVGGLLLGLIGVGTALISVPFLTIFLPRFGIGPDAAPLTALATSMAIVSVGSISSIASHHRLGNVDFLVSLLVSVPFFVKAVLQSHAPHHDLLAAAAAILTPLGLHAWVPGAACALNCPNWSISTEFFFYAVFPLVFVRVLRRPVVWCVESRPSSTPRSRSPVAASSCVIGANIAPARPLPPLAEP